MRIIGAELECLIVALVVRAVAGIDSYDIRAIKCHKTATRTAAVGAEVVDPPETMENKAVRLWKKFYAASVSDHRIDALEYWTTFEHVYGTAVAVVARKYVGLPGSSAQVERQFSTAGLYEDLEPEFLNICSTLKHAIKDQSWKTSPLMLKLLSVGPTTK